MVFQKEFQGYISEEKRMISLVFCGDLKYCPYIKRYTERLDEKKEQYEVLFWNRGNFKLNLPDNFYWYDSPSSEDLSKGKKLLDFFGFKRWVENHIKSHKTNGLILLSTLTAILLYDKLGQYKYKYIFDIRDYSYENIGIFRMLEKKAITNSFFTAISSKGFVSFLPQHHYVIAHNFNRNEMVSSPKFIRQAEPLKLVWNGTVRFFDFQKLYLDVLKNDQRFIMVYHGSGTDLQKYKDYCEKNGIKNVLFTGPYDNRDKEKLLSGAAILNNCYGGRDGDQLRFAISNRFYDGLLYHIPQLVEIEGYKAGVVADSGVGIALEAEADFADNLYNYYTQIDADNFDDSCNSALVRVLSEDDEYIRQIDRFIDGLRG